MNYPRILLFPFSPSINLFHHLEEELVFPLRSCVILPTHYIKQCQCTIVTARLCRVPAHNASFHFKSKDCAGSTFSLPSFPSWLLHACIFQGQEMLLIHSHLLHFPLSISVFIAPTSCATCKTL